MNPDFSLLDHAGLNLRAVFALDALPARIRQQLGPTGGYRQLILIGHGGRKLWRQVQAAAMTSEHPIDDFSVAAVRAWFAAEMPKSTFSVLYPGEAIIGLQTLGELAGWHHRSPFRVGINAAWGSWFAYRAAVLADTALTLTPPLPGVSPCANCRSRPCVDACPAGALGGRAMADDFSLSRCLTYRTQPDSRCALTCLARETCPVRPEHRYEQAQIAHSYVRSLAMIRAYHLARRSDGGH